MATHLSSYGELTAMPPEELRRDIAAQRTLVRKMRLGVEMKKEKDTARYRREKRQLSRMLTAQGAQQRQPKKVLKSKPKSRIVSASVPPRGAAADKLPSATAGKADVSSSTSAS
ncbi:MAG: hypothetical protein WCV62_06330 [Candidatus Peribacteraceae bacterium]|jgi:hypothetical protein